MPILEYCRFVAILFPSMKFIHVNPKTSKVLNIFKVRWIRFLKHFFSFYHSEEEEKIKFKVKNNFQVFRF